REPLVSRLWMSTLAFCIVGTSLLPGRSLLQHVSQPTSAASNTNPATRYRRVSCRITWRERLTRALGFQHLSVTSPSQVLCPQETDRKRHGHPSHWWPSMLPMVP